MSVNFNINVDASELIRVGLGFLPRNTSWNDRMIDNGNGRWISYQGDGKVVSMTFHKTKEHSATAQSRNTAKSTKGPGEWAIAVVASVPFYTDKTFYDFW